MIKKQKGLYYYGHWERYWELKTVKDYITTWPLEGFRYFRTLEAAIKRAKNDGFIELWLCLDSEPLWPIWKRAE